MSPPDGRGRAGQLTGKLRARGHHVMTGGPDVPDHPAAAEDTDG
ncbi:hypothetical protein AB0D86_15630 [Streptomyces sp. NPDC048324]